MKFGIRNCGEYNAPQVPLLRAPLTGELALTKSKTEGYNAPQVPLLRAPLTGELALTKSKTEGYNAP